MQADCNVNSSVKVAGPNASGVKIAKMPLLHQFEEESSACINRTSTLSSAANALIGREG